MSLWSETTGGITQWLVNWERVIRLQAFVSATTEGEVSPGYAHQPGGSSPGVTVWRVFLRGVNLQGGYLRHSGQTRWLKIYFCTKQWSVFCNFFFYPGTHSTDPLDPAGSKFLWRESFMGSTAALSKVCAVHKA